MYVYLNTKGVRYEQACNKSSVFLCGAGREYFKVLNFSIKAHYGQWMVIFDSSDGLFLLMF